jgi:hypothetical protein
MKEITRRKFLAMTAGIPGYLSAHAAWATPEVSPYSMVARVDHNRILTAANRYLSAMPITVTATRSTRSAGGLHDYFSEGDYWWPDPKHPDGPYIRRDGMSNPANFNAHRNALIRLSLIVPALVSSHAATESTQTTQDGIYRRGSSIQQHG